jgi:hypothetical protein
MSARARAKANRRAANYAHLFAGGPKPAPVVAKKTPPGTKSAVRTKPPAAPRELTRKEKRVKQRIEAKASWRLARGMEP